ncbi:CAP domain-containing protein [Paenibacillus sp. Z3-2]
MMKLSKLATATALSVLLSVSMAAVTEAAGQPQFKDVPKQHWGYAGISWAIDNGLAQGDGQGNFRPSTAVTEPEFLAMLMRLYKDDITLPSTDSTDRWYTPYYETAYAMGWPVRYGGSSAAYSRGEAAALIAYAASGEETDTTTAIQYLLNQGIANGKTSNTVKGFGVSDTITRAEAVTLLKNVKEKLPSLSKVTTEGLTLLEISLGDSEAAVIGKIGQPDRKDASGYGFTWYIYNKDYAKYAQIGIESGKVVALYSNAPGVWSSDNGIQDGITVSELSSLIGEQIDPSSTSYMTSKQFEDITYYLDTSSNQKVDAILVSNRIATATGAHASGAGNREEQTHAMELQVFDLANVFRQKNGISLLQWDDHIASTARKHSQDMSDREYFNHSNPEGQSPFDRMKADGIVYSRAAENIAYGYIDAMDVHNGWLNSSGHRKNMLNGNLQRLGVGIFGTYYTQNFYTPK